MANKKTIPFISSSLQTAQQSSSPTNHPPIPHLVDELGLLDSQIEEITNLIPADKRKTLALLEKQRKTKQEELIAAAQPDAERESILEGSAYTALVSPAANQRIISVPMSKVQKTVDATCGRGAFLKNCSITLTALDELLPVEARQSLIHESRTGRRTVKTAAKAVIEHKQAA